MMKNRVSLTIIILIILVLSGIILAACSSSIVGISIYNQPHKTAYIVGEDLDIQGFTLSVAYSKGSTKIIEVTPSMITGFDTSSVGTRSMVITYNVSGKVYRTTQEYVTVGRRAETLELLTPPTKVSYVDGERVVLAGIEIKVTYNNGETAILEESAFTNTPVIARLGNTSVTVKMDNATVSYNIEVSNKAVAGLSIRQNPNKTVYVEGENFDPTGLILSIVYNNLETEQVSEDYEVLTPIITADIEGVWIRYKTKDVLCPITILPAEIISYTIVAQQEYSVGDTIDLEGLVIELEYNNGNKVDISYANDWDNFQLVSPKGTLSLDDVKIELLYYYDTDKYVEIEMQIFVSEPWFTEFEFGRYMYKTEYIANEAIDLDGFELIAVYSNGTKVTIIDNEVLDSDVTYPLIAVLGMTELIFQYKGESFVYPVPIRVTAE